MPRKSHRVTKTEVNRTALADLVHAPEVQAEVTRVADVVRMRQTYAVPVLTGNLQDHIEVRVSPRTGGRLIGVWDVEYVLPVEYGHHTQSGTWVPAQPFIRPSLGGL